MPLGISREIHETPVLELEKLCKARSKNAIALLEDLGAPACED